MLHEAAQREYFAVEILAVVLTGSFGASKLMMAT